MAFYYEMHFVFYFRLMVSELLSNYGGWGVGYLSINLNAPLLSDPFTAIGDVDQWKGVVTKIPHPQTIRHICALDNKLDN